MATTAVADRHLLVDGNNLLARAHYQGQKMGLSVHGIDTGTLLVFANMLSKHVRVNEPTHVCVYWDSGYLMRTGLYPAYKANRDQHSGSDSLPMEQAKMFLTLAGVPHRARPGWEADDLIAYSVRNNPGEKVIVSSDRDLLQMLGPDTVQIAPPDETPWDADRFEAKYGYPPEQYPYVKALMGDKGDNVPGLRGIGPVKAVKMMTEAGWDWTNVWFSMPNEQRDAVALSLRLVDLRNLDYEAEGLMLPPPPTFRPTGRENLLWGQLQTFLAGLEMSTVIERLDAQTLWSGPSDGLPGAQRDQSREAFSDTEFV